MQGNFKAKAVEGELGFTNGGKEQVAVLFEIVDGENKGKRLTWHGYFTERTEERTIQSLLYAGWDGVDIGRLTGLGSAEVELVVEEEEYDGKTQTKVQWVNRVGGLALKDRMNDAQKASFAQRMKGRAAGIVQRMKQSGEDASFSFGANSSGDDGPPI